MEEFFFVKVFARNMACVLFVVVSKMQLIRIDKTVKVELTGLDGNFVRTITHLQGSI